MSIIKLVLCVEYWFHFVLLSTGKHAHSLYLHLTIIAVADHNAMYGWLNLDKKTGPVSRHDKIITSVSQSILYFWFYVNFVLLLCNSKDFILRSVSGRQPGSQDSPTCKFYVSRSGLTRSGSPTSRGRHNNCNNNKIFALYSQTVSVIMFARFILLVYISRIIFDPVGWNIIKIPGI